MIDSELGLAADLVVPCVDLSEAIINVKKILPTKFPACEGAKHKPSACPILDGDFGPKQENGPSPTFAFSTGCMRPPLQDISNVIGLMNKPKAST